MQQVPLAELIEKQKASREQLIQAQDEKKMQPRAFVHVGAVGHTQSGKSTVLRSIAGLYPPQEGRVVASGETWLDTDAGIDLPPQARSVGLVFQDYALFPHLSALDNVRLAMLRLPEPERSHRASELLARVHLQGLDARRPDPDAARPA